MLDPKLVRESPDWSAPPSPRSTCPSIWRRHAIDSAWRAQLQEVECCARRKRRRTPPWRRCPRQSGIFGQGGGNEGRLDRGQGPDRNAERAGEKFRQAMLSCPISPRQRAGGRGPDDNVVYSTWEDVSAVSPMPGRIGKSRLRPAVRFRPRRQGHRGGFPFYIGDAAKLIRSLLGFS